MVRMTKKAMGGYLLAILFAVSVFSFSGCSQNGTGPDASGAYSSQGTLSVSEGGAVSVTIPDGTIVTVEIPEDALIQSTDVTLAVTPEGSRESASTSKAATVEIYASLKITVNPATDLLDAATVSVVFPEKAGVVSRCMTQENDNKNKIPLKQGFSENTLKATVYSLGNMECAKPVVNDMVTTAYEVMAATPSGSWQDAYGLFDALLYYSTVFGENGKNAESQECFQAAAQLCKKSADAFLQTLGGTDGEKDDLLVNALKKFRNLMILCENPDGIVASFDAKLTLSDS